MYLYRKLMQAVTLATALVGILFPVQAQYRAPRPERKTPRAIAVLETFKNGSARLVPVSFFYGGHYYDATFYHATPVPFTLYSQTVYEVQRFGKPLGTFTVQSASRTAAEWFGNGRFKAAPDEATLARRRAQHPVVIDDPSRAVLHRRAGSEGDRPAAHPAAAATAPEEDEDPDRPKLHRREGSGSGAAETAGTQQAPGTAPTPGAAPAQTPGAGPTPGNPAPGGPTPEASGQDPDRPKLQRREGSAAGKNTAGSPAAAAPTAAAPAAAAAPAPAELTPSEDPDHPILRRGKPATEKSVADLPDFKKEEPVLRQVAVSDAGPSEVPTLIYVGPQQERQQMEESARELARAELRRLAAQRGLGLPEAPAPKSAAQTRKPAAKAVTPPPLAFEDEQFVPYDLDYNNYATVVFSARYAPQAAAGPDAGSPGAGAREKSWVVTVVARQDEDKLVKLYSAVSDPRELDLYPEVRLVDAVDPDGYGRYALLFREQKRDGASWLLGRVTGYELQTLFETAER